MWISDRTLTIRIMYNIMNLKPKFDIVHKINIFDYDLVLYDGIVLTASNSHQSERVQHTFLRLTRNALKINCSPIVSHAI